VSETAEQTHALHPVLDALFARIRAEVPAERRDALEAFAKRLRQDSIFSPGRGLFNYAEELDRLLDQ